MDPQRRKELQKEWKQRHPSMGVIAITCTTTGDEFFTTTKDTNTGFNRHTFQLGISMHPNKTLQKLWDAHGESNFAFSIIRELEYDDPNDDLKDDLEALLELCFEEHPHARKL